MKTALITGATDGIGKAAALKLLSQGWRTVIIGRNELKCQNTVEELKEQSGNNDIISIAADLSCLKDAEKACDIFLNQCDSLDLLLLNANAISNERVITSEGFEKNFALGYLSRVLMIKKLEKVLLNTERSQILSVVGKSYSPLDFEDLTIEKKFSGWKGLTRWQWAMMVFGMVFIKQSPILYNTYMPGLVKTKILADEPQPLRTIVKIMNVIIGISPQKSAGHIFEIINEINIGNIKGNYYSITKPIAFPSIAVKEDDQKKLLQITDDFLKTYL